MPSIHATQRHTATVGMHINSQLILYLSHTRSHTRAPNENCAAAKFADDMCVLRFSQRWNNESIFAVQPKITSSIQSPSILRWETAATAFSYSFVYNFAKLFINGSIIH